MTLARLDLFIPAAEAAAHAQKMLAQISALQNAAVELADNSVITRGKISLGLSVPFEARWHVAALATHNVILTLQHLDARVFGMGATALSAALMKFISTRLAEEPGIRVEGNAIYVDAAIVLKQQFGVELRGTLREVATTREGVSIRVEPS